jgi:hypothetical protein
MRGFHHPTFSIQTRSVTIVTVRQKFTGLYGERPFFTGLQQLTGAFARDFAVPASVYFDETEPSQRSAHPENQGAYNTTSPHQYIHWMLSAY